MRVTTLATLLTAALANASVIEKRDGEPHAMTVPEQRTADKNCEVITPKVFIISMV